MIYYTAKLQLAQAALRLTQKTQGENYNKTMREQEQAKEQEALLQKEIHRTPGKEGKQSDDAEGQQKILKKTQLEYAKAKDALLLLSKNQQEHENHATTWEEAVDLESSEDDSSGIQDEDFIKDQDKIGGERKRKYSSLAAQTKGNVSTPTASNVGDYQKGIDTYESDDLLDRKYGMFKM
jgi:hypothetical protein